MRVLILILILLSFFVGHSHADDLFPLDAIGRLVIDNQRLCTAFVVRSIEREAKERESVIYYENWIVSAGHCRGDDIVFYPQRGTFTYALVTLVAYSAGPQGHDLLIGKFNSTMPLPTLELGFAQLPAVGTQVMLVGYGRGALMARVGEVTGYDVRGYMEINNYASPGNSGGPVLLPGTRTVVGVAIQTYIVRPSGASPMFCLIAGCPIEPPYVAAPVERLLGMVRWP